MPRLLDLFCGAGGAAVGYSLAGFDVVGVDIKPMPRYPFEFHQGDALEYLAAHGHEFDAIHASPPCQMFSAYRRAMPDRGDEHYVNLIPDTREALRATGLPYVIENVPKAPLIDPVMLCGSMFDPPLDVQRHRLFETNWRLRPPDWPCRHKIWAPRFDRGSRHIRPNDRKTVAIGEWRIPLEIQQRAMRIDWMTVPELSQSIPPAYTEYIGRQLLAALAEELTAPSADKHRSSQRGVLAVKFITTDFSGVRIHDGTNLDYPTAWAIQHEVGESLEHHPRCSSVPGWDPISGPGLLCDCGAVEREWERRTRQQPSE